MTMEDVARIMREEDAHLLESMHFEQSCSTGETPVLISRLAPIDDVEPLHFDAPVGDRNLGGGSLLLEQSVEFTRQRSWQSDNTHNSRDVFYRQCLSGEIKSFRKETAPETISSPVPNMTDAGDDKTEASFEDDADADADAVPEGEETTASTPSEQAYGLPSVASFPSVVVDHRNCPTSNPADDHKRRRTQDDRRMNEAVQFAQAVGEMPPMDSNELCIIEEDDDDEDDDGNGTVIRLDEMSSVHDHLSVIDNTSSCQDANAAGATSDQGEEPPIPREIFKRKSRPRWPLQLPRWTFSHLDNSSYHENMVQDYVYKGIHSNPPEVVKRGMSRGNHVQLHRKAWLEVSDKYHRYGKNLRLYYRHWESLGYPTNMFFDWLDSKGEAAGRPLPNLEECPRSKLDSDTVLYITNPDVTKGYSLRIVAVEGRGRFLDVDGELVRTGPDGWIFVLRDGVIYGAEKITSITGQSKQRFHHSSFFGGKAVAAAGIIITDEEGFLTRLYPHSGHYRPREAHMQRLLYFLYHEGVDLRTFEMDTQQIMHVARDAVDGDKDKKGEKDEEVEEKKDQDKALARNNHEKKDGGEKKKKIDSLQLMPAVSVACYVAHKAHFIGEGIFAQIHQIRNANVASVTEALQYVNGKQKKKDENVSPLADGVAAEEA